MLEIDERVCQLLLAVMETQPKSENLNLLIEFNHSFWQHTQKVRNSNIDNWSTAKIEDYNSRVFGYCLILDALEELKDGRHDVQDLEDDILKAISAGKRIYQSVNSEYTVNWNSYSEEKRKSIYEDILLNHLITVRYLETFIKSAGNSKEESVDFNYYQELFHQGHRSVIDFF